jgi:nucleotide-binding universal stress UspA family protein
MVLAAALRGAADLGTPLEAVRVVGPDADLDAARQELEATVAAARRAAPAVPVTTTVVVDRPARALLDRAAGADELVIGHRRHGPATTLRGPGSTARSVLVGMTCPVVVLGPGALAGTAAVAAEGAR